MHLNILRCYGHPHRWMLNGPRLLQAVVPSRPAQQARSSVNNGARHRLLVRAGPDAPTPQRRPALGLRPTVISARVCPAENDPLPERFTLSAGREIDAVCRWAAWEQGAAGSVSVFVASPGSSPPWPEDKPPFLP